jgi:chromosomal replication initiation ATPase DnaA
MIKVAHPMPSELNEYPRPEARSLSAWAVRELTDATLNDLAASLARDASTLSAVVRRFEVRCKNEPELAEKIARLKKELAVFQA